MTTLQTIMSCVWGFIALGFLYTVGSAFGGRRGGFELIAGAIGALALYGGIGAILYFTIRALMGY